MASVGRHQFAVDLTAGTVDINLMQSRNPQATDDVYTLAIDNFLRADSLTVQAVSQNPSTIDIDLQFSHPFAPPTDLDGPATASNRSDLAIAARLVVLLDGTTAFFDGSVITNDGLLANPDGYLTPGELINTSGKTANTFPYLRVVDETADGNRAGISNGGARTGNYDPSTGWQRSNYGPNFDEWTGYGILHHGQTAEFTLSLDRALLSSSSFVFESSLLAKYNDPRGGLTTGEKRANRLPPNPADVTRFSYRMPHGALDIERIEFLGEDGTWREGQANANTLNFHVTDWDARAAETAEADLANDTTVSNVAIGESGLPGFAVSVPQVITGGSDTVIWDPVTDVLDDDSLFGGDAGQDSGQPDDALFYSRSIPANVPLGVAGQYPALARAEDPVATFEDWRFFLGPDLVPIASQEGELDIYQLFAVQVVNDNTPPSGNAAAADIRDGRVAELLMTNLMDVEGDDIEIQVDWNNTGTFVSAGVVSPPFNDVPLISPGTYTFSGPAPDIRDLPVKLIDQTSLTEVTITPTPTFEVHDCSLPLQGTARTTPWGTFRSVPSYPSLFEFANFGLTIPNDYGAYITPTMQGGVIQAWDSLPVDKDLYFLNADTPPLFPATQQPRITDMRNDELANRLIKDMAITSTGRFFLAVMESSVVAISTSSVVGIKYNPSVAGNSPTEGNAPDIPWFDWSGSGMVSDFGGTISTGTDQPIALEVDWWNDDLYMIDANHMLHRYIASLGYLEDTTGFPVDLTGSFPNPGDDAGPGTGTAIYDFVINANRSEFYVLAQLDVLPDGRLVRLGCDGSVISSTDFTLSGITSFFDNDVESDCLDLLDPAGASFCDIYIDQFDDNGNFMADLADQQMMINSCGVFSCPSGEEGEQFHHIDANLTFQASYSLTNPTSGSTRGLVVMDTYIMANTGVNSTQANFWHIRPSDWD